ncbi:MAG: hypothetical protein GWN86_29165, partial [Desulfobacterales bacterium]|nr:hypothetical protein [Desulfobacterales bacterium]NIW16499.1 hypothetical protein [Candidatus Bathyarchaeota archaeon]
MEKQTTEAGENVTSKEEGGHENSEIKQESSNLEAVPEGAEAAKGEEDSKQFMEMYEESLRSLQEGELVKGEIVQINKEFILVDIGYKSEG